MIQLTAIKDLLLTSPTQPNRPAHLSAASGLVNIGPWLYVVADDELHLGKFLLEGTSAGDIVNCFPGELPIEKEERKAEKPDIEVLTLIPQLNNPSYHALLALGSGSKKNRNRGVMIPLDPSGNIVEPAQLIDLSYLFEFLKREIGKLNIEGATVIKNDILLFQRGNKKNKLNASIRLSLKDFHRAIAEPNYDPHIQIKPYDLGEIDQVPLCFTDATSLQDGTIIFTAAAENTSDSYLDGTCMGSAIGRINSTGNLELLEPIDKNVKLEGISAKENDSRVELLLVTDADDSMQPAQLYSAYLPF